MGAMERQVGVEVLDGTHNTVGPSAQFLGPCLATIPGFVPEPSFAKPLGILHEGLPEPFHGPVGEPLLGHEATHNCCTMRIPITLSKTVTVYHLA